MVEAVLAVLIITFVFLTLFQLSHLLTGKILLEHAAMRVARARAVGFNDFMCVKAARVSVIPVAGKRLWPAGDRLDSAQELANVAIYMGTPNEAVARGVLEYRGWDSLSVEPGDGTDVRTGLEIGLFDETVRMDVEGRAGIEESHVLYMNDQGR